MIIDKGYDVALWCILSADKKNRPKIVEFIKSIPQELLTKINDGILQLKKYSHNLCIYNHNEKEIDCNIFCNNDYSCISAIIFSTADLTEHYTENNTFLFINPYANNKIYANKFSNLIYWRAQKVNNEYHYFPRYKGRNLNDMLSKKYW